MIHSFMPCNYVILLSLVNNYIYIYGCGYFHCTLKMTKKVILTDNYATPSGRRVRTRDRLLANEIMPSDVATRPQ